MLAALSGESGSSMFCREASLQQATVDSIATLILGFVRKYIRGLKTVDDLAKSGGMRVRKAGTVLGGANIVHKHNTA